MIDLGAFVFPNTSIPVPVKSKEALLCFWSIVKFKVNGVPSSIYYVLVKVPIYPKLLSIENLYSKFLTDFYALSHIKLTYALNSVMPYSLINLFNSLDPV